MAHIRAKLADPFATQDYERRKMNSARDALVLALDSAILRVSEATADLTDAEYHWEPIPPSERMTDLELPPERKRVWRLYERDGKWDYDYGDGEFTPPPFTTIAWLLNHIGSTADMYLYCIQSGKPVGVERNWWDIPVPSTREAMIDYVFQILEQAQTWLLRLPDDQFVSEMNGYTPAPWGEMRPTYLNLWGGVIEHALLHAMQIAVRKEQIRGVR